VKVHVGWPAGDGSMGWAAEEAKSPTSVTGYAGGGRPNSQLVLIPSRCSIPIKKKVL